MLLFYETLENIVHIVCSAILLKFNSVRKIPEAMHRFGGEHVYSSKVSFFSNFKEHTFNSYMQGSPYKVSQTVSSGTIKDINFVFLIRRSAKRINIFRTIQEVENLHLLPAGVL